MKSLLPSDPQARQKAKQFIALAVMAVGAVIFIPSNYTSGMIGIKDLHRQRQRLEAQVSGLEQELADNQAVLAREDALKRERNELAPMIEHYESRLPSTVEMPEVLRELDTIANRSGQMFSKHERVPPVESGAIVELPYKIELHSDYHGFGRFLNAIENAQRFAKVDDISIEFDKDDFVRHKVSLTLSTFIFNEDRLTAAEPSAEAAAPADAGAPAK